MAVQREASRRVIQRCRAKGITVVAGGPLFTTESEAFESVDHLVLDEAEVTLPMFLADLARGTPQHVYRAGDHPQLHDSPIPHGNSSTADGT